MDVVGHHFAAAGTVVAELSCIRLPASARRAFATTRVVSATLKGDNSRPTTFRCFPSPGQQGGEL